MRPARSGFWRLSADRIGAERVLENAKPSRIISSPSPILGSARTAYPHRPVLPSQLRSTMLRAPAAARLASRAAGLARAIRPATPVAVQRLALATLAPTRPAPVKASQPDFAPAEKEPAAATPTGKISQVIGAVVDVHFGKSLAPHFPSRSRRADDAVMIAAIFQSFSNAFPSLLCFSSLPTAA